MKSYNDAGKAAATLYKGLESWETAWHTASSAMLQQLQLLNEEQMNRKPEGGGWSAAQVAWHVWKSESNILKLMRGNVTPPTREPSALIGQIQNDFGDRSNKMESPSWIDPRDKMYNREELITGLDRTAAEVQHAAGSLDLSQICTDFAFPVYGHLSRLELLHFMLVHKERHLVQLKGIL